MKSTLADTLKSNLVACVSLFVLASATSAAFANEGRFYVGLSVAAEDIDISHDKTTANDPDPIYMLPQAGNIYHDSDSNDDTEYGFGFLAGYRMPLNAGSLYLDSEIDAGYHSGSVRGQLAGVGDSPGRNLHGESWPDAWSFEKDKSYGLTFRLGGSPAWLQSWGGSGTSIYALAGMRRVKTQFKIDFFGCGNPDGCPPGEFSGGRLTVKEYTTAWVGGAGLEKMFGEQTALRGEFRYTDYETVNWLSLPAPGLRIPAEFDGDETSLTLNLVRYF